MIKELMHDPIFLAGKSEVATKEDLQVAGDSFCATFLARYMKTGDVSGALDLATKISGYVLSHIEAIPEYAAEDFVADPGWTR